MRKLFMIWMLWPMMALCQDSSAPAKLVFNGYLKDMAAYTLPNSYTTAQFTNLVHNRMNLRYNDNKGLSAAFELRSRFFWGDAVKNDPYFTQHLRNAQELVNLSVVWFSGDNAAAQSNVERFWLDYEKGRWKARVGRQRINWGVNNAWNPNDIFNAYNLLDFDYEERAGADAVKLQYHLGELSTMEAAVAKGADGSTTAAIKYALNRDGYDWQMLLGTYGRKRTAGLGWSGNIGKAGFKGEAQLFYKKDSLVFNASTELDYITGNGWYFNGAFLFNGSGVAGPVTDWSRLSFRNTPDNLMPTRWNILAGSSKQFTPLFSGSLTLIYAPGTNMLVLFPSLRYNISTDIDIDLFWQSFLAETPKGFDDIVHQGYLRVKWSF